MSSLEPPPAREGYSVLITFAGLCMVGGLAFGVAIHYSWQEVHQIKTAASPITTPSPPASIAAPVSTVPDTAKPDRAVMERWWQVHQMEEWWRVHQAKQRPAQRRPVAAKLQPKDVKLAEQSWGVEDTGYNPPRYLNDTTRWPLHENPRKSQDTSGDNTSIGR